MKLNYTELEKEIIEILEKQQSIILATSADNMVSARTMCHVNDGLDIMFSTDGKSGKVVQMKKNPNVALAVGELQIEAVVELFGNPSKHEIFIKLNETKFPWMKDAFKTDPDKEDTSMLVICYPVKIRIYKYIDGKPMWDVLDPVEKSACRLSMEEIRTI